MNPKLRRKIRACRIIYSNSQNNPSLNLIENMKKFKERFAYIKINTYRN